MPPLWGLLLRKRVSGEVGRASEGGRCQPPAPVVQQLEECCCATVCSVSKACCPLLRHHKAMLARIAAVAATSRSAFSFAGAARRFFGSLPPPVGLSEEQGAILEVAQSFARDKLAPKSAEWDAKHVFPVDTLREAAELGFAGLFCSEDHGGTGERPGLVNMLIWQGRRMAQNPPTDPNLRVLEACTPSARLLAHPRAGLTRLDGALVFEALAHGDVATTAYLTIHNMVAAQIDR